VYAKSALVHALRQRQYTLSEISTAMIDALSADAIIDAYSTCACYGAKHITPEQRRVAIFMAKDADGFVNVCDQLGRKHV
jgi:hypothetical protein